MMRFSRASWRSASSSEEDVVDAAAPSVTVTGDSDHGPDVVDDVNDDSVTTH